jgi:hypothetical protein
LFMVGGLSVQDDCENLLMLGGHRESPVTLE